MNDRPPPGPGPADSGTIFSDAGKFREVLAQAQGTGAGDGRPYARSNPRAGSQTAYKRSQRPGGTAPAPAWVRLEDVLRTTAAAEECLRNAGASYTEKSESQEPVFRLNAEAAAAQEAAMRDVRPTCGLRLPRWTPVFRHLLHLSSFRTLCNLT